jgi:alkanesulfonate monooxygenase SsuD/methylene tetrahydromethanopterin reductase-like flavin-dependent oxidoreductase (luciferase family)
MLTSCRGRLRLGVGVGWNHVEYEALGQDFRTRGARQEEQIGLLRRLFTEPVVDFPGRFDRVDRAALAPRPARSIPIWLGGSGDAAFERAARLADGFIFFGGGTHAIDAWKRLRGRVSRLGRPTEDFGADYVALPRGGVGGLTAEVDAGARQAAPTSRWSPLALAWTPPKATSTTSPRSRTHSACRDGAPGRVTSTT